MAVIEVDRNNMVTIALGRNNMAVIEVDRNNMATYVISNRMLRMLFQGISLS